MAAADNDDVIPTSCDAIILFCGRQRKQFLTYYLPSKFHCHSFNAVKVLNGTGGGGGGLSRNSPQAQEQKSPGQIEASQWG